VETSGDHQDSEDIVM